MNLRRMANLFGRGNFGQESTEVGAKKEDVMVKEISSTEEKPPVQLWDGTEGIQRAKTPPLNTLSCEDPVGFTGRKPRPRGSWKIH